MRARAICIAAATLLLTLIWCANAAAYSTIATRYDVDVDAQYASAPAVSGSLVAWYDYDSVTGHRAIMVKGLISGDVTELTSPSADIYGGLLAAGDDAVAWETLAGSISVCHLGGSPVSVGTTQNNALFNFAMDGNLLVWTDYDAVKNESYIRCYDVDTGTTTTPVITSPGIDGLDIDGSRIVWAQGASSNSMDIYGCDLPDATPYPICTSSGEQRHPAVDGDIVVWEDYSADSAGDVRGRDLAAETNFTVTDGDGVTQQSPAVSGDWVVYEQTDDLYVYDVAAGTPAIPYATITGAGAAAVPDSSSRLGADEGLVAWHDAGASHSASDVIAARFVKWTTSLQLAGGAEWTKDRDVAAGGAATSSAGNIDSVRFLQTGDAWQPWVDFIPGVTATLSGPDGEKEITAEYRDVLGDVSDQAVDTIKLDTTKPVTTSDADDAWHNHDVNVLLSPDDGSGSGVDTTHYRLDSGLSWSEGTSVPVPATADHAGDGVHLLEWYSTDVAGNDEAVQSHVVRIDTTGPVTSAPSRARVTRGRAAKLAFKVADALSPQAVVTIRVYKRSGGLVRTLKVGLKATGVRATTSFRCTLRRGTYRFRVFASDLAGNAQSKIGANWLTVK
jgi:beta propeller repeat protein